VADLVRNRSKYPVLSRSGTMNRSPARSTRAGFSSARAESATTSSPGGSRPASSSIAWPRQVNSARCPGGGRTYSGTPVLFGGGQYPHLALYRPRRTPALADQSRARIAPETVSVVRSRCSRAASARTPRSRSASPPPRTDRATGGEASRARPSRSSPSRAAGTSSNSGTAARTPTRPRRTARRRGQPVGDQRRYHLTMVSWARTLRHCLVNDLHQSQSDAGSGAPAVTSRLPPVPHGGGPNARSSCELVELSDAFNTSSRPSLAITR